MGKQGKRSKNGMPKLQKKPFVSICMPTYNRRPFIPYAIKCIENQKYPKDKMELIIIDDGQDKIKDLVHHLPYVKYFEYDEKMTLGKKRNISHEKAKGDIILYMDDDDYYPPERVSHAVECLVKNPKFMIAGSSKLFIYFKHIDKIYSFGPYAPYHATAATFAFRKELLKDTQFEQDACLAEEKLFLKEYTIPLYQLDPMKTILVFSHDQNTFDKKQLLNNKSTYVVETELTSSDFLNDEELMSFYTNDMHEALKSYDFGKIENKPDVIKQTNEIKNKRNKIQEDNMKKHYENQKNEIIKKNEIDKMLMIIKKGVMDKKTTA